MDNKPPFNYEEECQQTLSDSWHGNEVDVNELLHAVHQTIRLCEKLDGFKRALFYGDLRRIPARTADSTFAPLPSLDKRERDVLHGLLGAATEAGELLEAAYDVIKGTFDELNVLEEVGDGQWYAAIIVRALDSSLDTVQHANIGKLRRRFPGAFTEYDAQNRDLFAETQALGEKLNKNS